MSCYSLPGIKKIQIIPCALLPVGLMMHSACGCIVALADDAPEVEFSGIPVLTWEGSLLNGVRQEKATLEFSTVHPIPEGVNLAFVVTGAGGRQMLIGTNEPNYPVVSYSETTGSPTGAAAVRTYKISLTAQKAVLPCVL